MPLYLNISIGALSKSVPHVRDEADGSIIWAAEGLGGVESHICGSSGPAPEGTLCLQAELPLLQPSAPIGAVSVMAGQLNTRLGSHSGTLQTEHLQNSIVGSADGEESNWDVTSVISRDSLPMSSVSALDERAAPPAVQAGIVDHRTPNTPETKTHTLADQVLSSTGATHAPAGSQSAAVVGCSGGVQSPTSASSWKKQTVPSRAASSAAAAAATTVKACSDAKDQLTGVFALKGLWNQRVDSSNALSVGTLWRNSLQSKPASSPGSKGNVALRSPTSEVTNPFDDNFAGDNIPAQPPTRKVAGAAWNGAGGATVTPHVAAPSEANPC